MEEDVLKYAADNGIIDLSYVQKQIKMNKRKELLGKHPWKISQGSDGKWRTYLPDAEHAGKIVKRNTREPVEDRMV